MKTETSLFTITFTEPTLATSPGNRTLLTEYKQPEGVSAEKKKEEIEALPEDVQESIEKASTVFPRDDNGVFAWDYQLRGFFKEALLALIELGESTISKWAYKRAIDQFLFVSPRRIYYHLDGKNILTCDKSLERSLRVETMQGPRVCLARSEMLEAGTTLTFRVICQETSNPKSKVAVIGLDLVRAMLDRGEYVGFSQWRSGSYGRFTWTEQELT